MRKRMGILAFGFLAMPAVFSQTIHIGGVVKDASGGNLAGVEIKLLSKGLKDTSDAQGKFQFIQNSTGLHGYSASQGSDKSFQPSLSYGTGIAFNPSIAGLGQPQVFDLGGRLQSNLPSRGAAGIHLIKPEFLSYTASALSKAAAAVDSIQLSKINFTTTTFAVASWTDSNLSVTMAAATVTPLPTSWIPPSNFQTKNSSAPQGKLVEVTYDNALLNKTGTNGRKATVYLPPGYDATKKYPVLYALHGIGGDHKEWISYNTNVDQIFNNLYYAKKIEPMIVVFPNGRAMNPDKAPSDLYGSTNSNAFYDFWEKDMRDYLIKFIDKTYPTLADPQHRAVLGYSMGGMQALRFGLPNPAYFAYVGALAPAFLPDANSLNATTINSSFKQVFLSHGTADGTVAYSQSEGFDKTLTTKGIKHIWVPVQGGKHDGSTWCPGIYNFSQIIFK